MPFYNCHIHVFSAQSAPERFLQVGLPGWVDPFAGGIKNLLETRAGRWASYKLAKINWAPFKVASRYASFASVGTMSSQQMIFENVMKFYPAGSRFVVLTLNMDFMGAGKSALTFQGQVDQVVQLRRLYPDACLPFLSIDPRMGSAYDIMEFVEKYVGPGLPFIGIKLYPALGYFPFDARLEKVYAYCEENELPLMTHCTPSGAFFLGRLDISMGWPETIVYAESDGSVRKPFIPLPHNFSLKGNDIDTDVFLRPDNWDIVLAKYPKLKVCFAHLGGVGEIWGSRKPHTWYEDVKALMAAYENVYTDISYTLFDEAGNKRTWKEIKNLLSGAATNSYQWPNPPGNTKAYESTIKNRVMFGTDYFMTEQEDKESNLATKFPNWLLKQNEFELHKNISERNTERYLRSLFFTP